MNVRYPSTLADLLTRRPDLRGLPCLGYIALRALVSNA